MLNLTAERTIYQTSQLEKYFRENVSPYLHEEFNPSGIQDARERIARLVSKRRGQPDFRKRLLKAYNFKCAMSQCDAVPALEAAHIIPYNGPDTNHITNGLLLRADLHTLFDLCYISIDALKMSIVIHPDLRSTSYQNLLGKFLTLPEEKEFWPSKKALDMHRQEADF